MAKSEIQEWLNQLITFGTEIIRLDLPGGWFIKATAYIDGKPAATAHVMPWGEFMPDMLREAEDKAIKEVYRLAREYLLPEPDNTPEAIMGRGEESVTYDNETNDEETRVYGVPKEGMRTYTLP